MREVKKAEIRSWNVYVMKRLIFFTSVFPYPAKSMETYLETECQFYKHFDEVLLFSLGVRKSTLGQCRKLKADNVKIIPILFAPKWRYILNVYAALLDKRFYAEVKKLAREKRLNFKRLVRLLIYLSRSHYEAKIVRDKLLDIDLKSSENIVYVYRFEYHPYVPILLKKELGNCPMVARAHRYDLYEERNSDGYIPLRECLLHELDKICLISEDGRRYLENKFPKFAHKLIVCRLGTSDYGIEVDVSRTKFHIVSCSNVVPVKRVEKIVDILAEMDEIIEWTHFGAGEGFKAIKKYAQKLPDNIEYHFRGQMDNQKLMEEYQKGSFNLFINLSESEGVPVSIMEAMSFGIPCVATNVGGIGEIVNNGINGFLVHAEFSNSEVVEEIKSVMAMPEIKYKELCSNARKTWDENYNADKNYKEFEEMLYNMTDLKRIFHSQ